ncbi:hypothetical protein ACO22_01155 [Paracoccidioides brasiliensis]|uniref:Uncharacterized protein n=1 Tax=Paracoccidioides brasiliensis TaxID=121759 RepID=A0A1D2JM74_PARBR|nr:hypothetical protein ACO22_01155 [Paracoccidioides brasiliensis]
MPDAYDSVAMIVRRRKTSKSHLPQTCSRKSLIFQALQHFVVLESLARYLVHCPAHESARMTTQMPNNADDGVDTTVSDWSGPDFIWLRVCDIDKLFALPDDLACLPTAALNELLIQISKGLLDTLRSPYA